MSERKGDWREGRVDRSGFRSSRTNPRENQCAGAVSEIAGGRGAALTSKSFSRSLTLRFADKVNFTMVGLFPHRRVPTRALLLCSGGLGTTCRLILKMQWGMVGMEPPQPAIINPPTHIGPTAGPSPHPGYARRTPR